MYRISSNGIMESQRYEGFFNHLNFHECEHPVDDSKCKYGNRSMWDITYILSQRKHIQSSAEEKHLYDFKSRRGGDIMDHFQKLDDFCLSMKALGDVISPDEKMVFLLGSLSDKYDQIRKIIEDIREIDIPNVKEMHRREHEGMVKKEVSEVALQAAKYNSKEPYEGCKGRKEHKKKTTIKCFHCKRNRHMKKDYWKVRNGGKETMNEQAFSSYESKASGWMLDSGASCNDLYI
uniref:AlNc14C468G11819 protein n=1 Tax=Albugo laibachii Nc14 TaxID=890382 RepID=F0X081_9STRA|nr:AlNc14C468G11819 [Albugo laibachii Nc14]|eukprot:CCA27163.1 AlNc14C468G11819 [Albugo laibachii Nc14]